MSVMIKGMNFPKNCMECDLHFIARGLDNECIFSNDTVDDCTERRLYRCPLVEIPTPHGRLIDADYINGSGLIEWQKSIVKAEISQAPTVVEAEGVNE